MTLNLNTKAAILVLMCLPTSIWAQNTIQGKFINDNINQNNYIIFQKDSTFKYRLGFELYSDISCGKYTVKNDTISLFFTLGPENKDCNTENITSAIIGDTLSMKWRPEKLYLKHNKLYLIKNGIVQYKTERGQLDYKPNNTYRRKYLLFGMYQDRIKDTYYMVAEEDVKWKRH
ncbi:hypothetical protein [Pedobacter frigiditerrae]|uniref:hypothetical protein n=1 Tax=Pedobacter frigiditerrae TaxID=2530452 RepID=UPI00292F9400|nr:hypothetical protein [Pedobacter frigiditerrae]